MGWHGKKRGEDGAFKVLPLIAPENVSTKSLIVYCEYAEKG
jgi:hypothetical protein